MKKFFKSSKNIILCTCAALAVPAALIICLNVFRSPSIGFYGIDKSTQDAVKTVIEDWSRRTGTQFKYKALDNSLALSEAVSGRNRPDLLFTVNGGAVKAASAKVPSKAALSTDVTAEMTSTIRTTVIQDNSTGTVKALPLLSSHFEIDIDSQAFKRSKLKAAASWKDIEDFARYEKRLGNTPFIFAGKNLTT